ncbi:MULTISPECIES: hypothetical protein [Ensifer]|uniref:hypothetical protein n=1 Tax=unclassified Ensifer TaxID=2633371 RepID=UPI001FCD048E|nr:MULTISPECIES: hypothetical protein [unclassified Ensifer]
MPPLTSVDNAMVTIAAGKTMLTAARASAPMKCPRMAASTTVNSPLIIMTSIIGKALVIKSRPIGAVRNGFCCACPDDIAHSSNEAFRI